MVLWLPPFLSLLSFILILIINPKKAKPRLENPFFIIPIIIIIINSISIGISFFMQNFTNIFYNIFYIERHVSWNTAVRITDISLLVIILCIVIRVVFVIMKKINPAEFLIFFTLNFIALCFCLIVIFDRI